MLEFIWPIVTGVTFFDVWTLAHLGFWVVVGSSVWAFKVNKWLALFCCMLLAVAWELFEHFIAYPLWPNRWQDPESWVNSWISDLLMCFIAVLGIWYLLDHRRRRKGLSND